MKNRTDRHPHALRFFNDRSTFFRRGMLVDHRDQERTTALEGFWLVKFSQRQALLFEHPREMMPEESRHAAKQSIAVRTLVRERLENPELHFTSSTVSWLQF